MFYTEKDPFTGKKLFVELDNARKKKLKDIVTVIRKDGKKLGLAF